MSRPYISRDKHIREECLRLLQQGWTYRDGGKHTILYTPSRRYRVTVPVTPGGANRSMENFRADVRRAERMEKEHVSQKAIAP